MTKLEDSLRTSFHAVGSRLPDVDSPVVRPSTEAARRKWHGPAWALAAAAIVLIVMGGSAWLTRTQVESVFPASTPPEGLLYPPAGAHVTNTQVSEPRLEQTAGLVTSPDGVVYRVSVGPAIGELDPEGDRRDVGGRSFTLQRDDDNGVVGYVYLDTCVRFGVQAHTDAPAWNREVSSLLAALAVDGRQVVGVLPPGWQFHGAGPYGPMYQVVFEVTLNGETKLIALRQMPDTPVAALPLMSAGPISETTLNGSQAWTLDRDDGFTNLVWMENATAVQLEAQDVTVAELKAIASSLETTHRAGLWRDADVSPDDTAPLRESEEDARLLCGPTRLELTTGP